MGEKLSELLSRRDQLLQNFADIGDIRQGSMSENYRRCGRSGCCGADPDHPELRFASALANNGQQREGRNG